MECYPVQSEMSDTVKDILQNIEQASRMTVIVSEVLLRVFGCCMVWRGGMEGDYRTGKVRNIGSAGFPLVENPVNFQRS